MSNPFFDAMGGGNLPGPMGNMAKLPGRPEGKGAGAFDLRPDVPEPIQRIAGYGKSVPADVG